jgi:hypothetical protein
MIKFINYNYAEVRDEDLTPAMMYLATHRAIGFQLGRVFIGIVISKNQKVIEDIGDKLVEDLKEKFDFKFEIGSYYVRDSKQPYRKGVDIKFGTKSKAFVYLDLHPEIKLYKVHICCYNENTTDNTCLIEVKRDKDRILI